MALEVGSRLAHYDVTALIDEGGMGQVYQATEPTLVDRINKALVNERPLEPPIVRYPRETEIAA